MLIKTRKEALCETLTEKQEEKKILTKQVI